MKIFITGVAGFIGYHLADNLLKKGLDVIGIDNLNDYYDPTLKHARISELNITSKKFKANLFFTKGDLEDIDLLNNIFLKYKPNIVINLAAQEVRYSLKILRHI